jgi:hypothetical protein
MPTTRCEIGPVGKPVMKYMLHAEGDWKDVDEEKRMAWNRATAALGALADLYLDELGYERS